MSEFVNKPVTTLTVPTARLVRETFREVADVLNRVGPQHFVASPAFTLARRVNQFSLVVMGYAAIKIESPMQYEGGQGFRPVYTRAKGAGRLVALDLRRRVADSGDWPANASLVAEAFVNGVMVGASAQIGPTTEAAEVDLHLAAGAQLAANDLVEVRMRTLSSPWPGAGDVPRIFWSILFSFTEPLVAFP